MWNTFCSNLLCYLGIKMVRGMHTLSFTLKSFFDTVVSCDIIKNVSFHSRYMYHTQYVNVLEMLYRL